MTAGSPKAAAPRWPTKAEWRSAAVIVGVSRAAFLVVAWLARWLRSDATGPPDAGVSHWRVWDADIYAKIAELGYAGGDPWSEAFPPLWPLVIRAVQRGTGLGVTPAALVATTLATLVAVAFLIRLVDEEAPARADAAGGPTPGRRAGWYLVLFPTAVFLVAGYAEALFLAGAVPAFREARRGRWTRVGPFAAVAVGARWVGLFLVVGLAVELLRQRPDRRRLVRGGGALVLALLPAFAYAAWLQVVHGDPLYVLEAQRQGWGRGLTDPLTAFRTTWDTWHGGHATPLLVAWRLEIVAVAVGVALVGLLLRRREWGYAAFAGTTMAAMTTSSWYYSVPRILLSLFPLVILLAGWTARRPGRHDPVLATLTVSATLGVVVLTRGGWFF